MSSTYHANTIRIPNIGIRSSLALTFLQTGDDQIGYQGDLVEDVAGHLISMVEQDTIIESQQRPGEFMGVHLAEFLAGDSDVDKLWERLAQPVGFGQNDC